MARGFLNSAAGGGGSIPFDINSVKHAEAVGRTRGTVSASVILEADEEYMLIGSGSGSSSEAYHGANWYMSGNMSIPNTVTILDTVISNNVTYTANYGSDAHGGYCEHAYRVKTSAQATVTYNVNCDSPYGAACSESATIVAIPV